MVFLMKFRMNGLVGMEDVKMVINKNKNKRIKWNCKDCQCNGCPVDCPASCDGKIRILDCKVVIGCNDWLNHNPTITLNRSLS